MIARSASGQLPRRARHPRPAGRLRRQPGRARRGAGDARRRRRRAALRRGRRGRRRGPEGGPARGREDGPLRPRPLAVRPRPARPPAPPAGHPDDRRGARPPSSSPRPTPSRLQAQAATVGAADPGPHDRRAGGRPDRRPRGRRRAHGGRDRPAQSGAAGPGSRRPRGCCGGSSGWRHSWPGGSRPRVLSRRHPAGAPRQPEPRQPAAARSEAGPPPTEPRSRTARAAAAEPPTRGRRSSGRWRGVEGPGARRRRSRRAPGASRRDRTRGLGRPDLDLEELQCGSGRPCWISWARRLRRWRRPSRRRGRSASTRMRGVEIGFPGRQDLQQDARRRRRRSASGWPRRFEAVTGEELQPTYVLLDGEAAAEDAGAGARRRERRTRRGRAAGAAEERVRRGGGQLGGTRRRTRGLRRERPDETGPADAGRDAGRRRSSSKTRSSRPAPAAAWSR